MLPFPFFALVADLYTPLLAGVYLYRLIRVESVQRRARLYALLLNLATAWGMMLADRFWDIWPAWSLDYSTHTAVALAFVLCLSFSAPHQTLYWSLSLVAYAMLMRVLGYHSVADIATTALATGILMLPGGIWLYRKNGRNASSKKASQSGN